MLSIIDTSIRMTRGDSGTFTLIIKDPSTGGIYNPNENDVIIFTLRRNVKNCPNSPFLLQKKFKSGQIVLLPNDTQFLKCDTFLYDVQITFPSGSVNTVVSGTFKLLSEVS